MKFTELKWKSRDGVEILAQCREPDSQPPKAVVCLLHGLGEHSGRYAHVAEAFNREAYILVGADLRGHGRSGGARGHVDSIEDFMHDIDGLLGKARARYPGLPLILYGHSLGAILGLYYGLNHRPDLKGMIATSPALHSALENQPMKVLAAKVLGSLMPNLSLHSGLDPKSISRDEKVVRAYVNDPLVHYRVSLGFGKIILGVTKWTLEHAGEFTLPLLLMHGKADVLAFPSSSIEFAAALKDKCTLILWDGAYHELHNEPEQGEVFNVMTSWMDALLKD